MLRKDPLATQLLGDCYSTAMGVRGTTRNRRNFIGSLANGASRSLTALWEINTKGLAVEKNERKAVELCRKGADKGLPGAQTDLGEMYLMG